MKDQSHRNKARPERGSEYHDTKDGLDRKGRGEEFGRMGGEFFQEQKPTTSSKSCKSVKKARNHMRRMAMTLTCAAATVLAVPRIGVPPTVTLAVEPSQETEPLEVLEPEMQTGMQPQGSTAAETSEEELLFALTEDQIRFISQVCEAFESDDAGALQTLKDDAAMLSLCQGDLDNKVFVLGENEAFERKGYNGRGLLLQYTSNGHHDSLDFPYIKMSLVTLADGQAQGAGKVFSYSMYSLEEESNQGYLYFVGNFENNAAFGEGRIESADTSWYILYGNDEVSGEVNRQQEDTGQGIFADGQLIDGSGSFHWIESGTDSWRLPAYGTEHFREEVFFDQTYANGITVECTVRTINLDTGEETTHTQDIGDPQDHFARIKIRSY